MSILIKRQTVQEIEMIPLLMCTSALVDEQFSCRLVSICQVIRLREPKFSLRIEFLSTIVDKGCGRHQLDKPTDDESTTVYSRGKSQSG